MEINLGDTGGKLYYRILFYNYEDVIEFHDDLLQKFYGKIAFDQYIRIYDASTGDLIGTSKIWNGQHMDNNNQYNGDYRLHSLDEFQDCIIGLYYSIDVSGDEALADLEEGKTYTYINTVEWENVGKDSAEAQVTNSEATLKKVSTRPTKMEKIWSITM